jgi:hypothetical protein
MSRLERYISSPDFLTSDICPESILLQNLNKKHYANIKFYKTNIFIEVDNMDISLTKRNAIVFYPYNIKFIRKDDNKIKIPIFLENPSLLILLFNVHKIKYRTIEINDIQTELTEKEREYYYQEKLSIEIIISNLNLKI